MPSLCPLYRDSPTRSMAQSQPFAYLDLSRTVHSFCMMFEDNPLTHLGLSWAMPRLFMSFSSASPNVNHGSSVA